MVVEDDIPTLRLLVELAATAGLEAIPFTRLSPARRAVREDPPSVLLVDDDLPDGQGADFAAEIASDPSMRGVRVVVCTAADAARRRQIEHVGHVIPKPFALHQLERALQEVAEG
ncbi:MAG TPA: response regulator [Candidatus Limnocylindria bacterium]